jgi:hypothetical protein
LPEIIPCISQQVDHEQCHATDQRQDQPPRIPARSVERFHFAIGPTLPEVTGRANPATDFNC